MIYRMYLQTGFKLKITVEWIDVSALSDGSIQYKPPDLKFESRVVTEEDAINAVKEYFRRYNKLRNGLDGEVA